MECGIETGVCKEFTQKDFEEIKKYNRDKNRKCFMCLRAHKKPFEELTEADKYHITVCNPKKPFEWLKKPQQKKMTNRCV